MEQEKEATVLARMPRRVWRALILLCVLALGLCASLAGYDYGHQRGLALQHDLLAELEDLREWRRQSEPALADLSQRLVQQRYGARINRAAAEQVRSEMVAGKNELASLREELAFYRGLMRPSKSDVGLGIHSFKIRPGASPNHFEFEVVMRQLALRHRLLNGVVELSVAGRTATQASLVLSLKDLSATAGDDRIKFKFKYFERIRGEMAMPEGFVPEGVNISARTWGRPVQRLKKSYPWAVSGS